MDTSVRIRISKDESTRFHGLAKDLGVTLSDLVRGTLGAVERGEIAVSISPTRKRGNATPIAQVVRTRQPAKQGRGAAPGYFQHSHNR